MRFKSIEIQNFLSFGPMSKMDLNKRGLVAVFGQNRDSAASDSNGAGKSTIMEAIVWVLYGATMRGYKGDEVINRHVPTDRPCIVEIEMEDAQSTYTVTRCRRLKGKKPNDIILAINGKEVTQGVNSDTQALINTIIGMDFSTFTQSVMLCHQGRSFSEMKDSEQKQVLEEILQIDELAKARAVVHQRVITRQQSMAGVSAKLQAIASRREHGGVQLHKLTQQRNQHRTIMRQRKLDLQQQKAAAEVRMEDVYRTTGLDVLLERQRDLQLKQGKLEKKRAKIQQKEVEITKKYGNERADIANELGQLQGSFQTISPAVNAMSTLAGKTCSTCHRGVDPDEASATITALEERGEQLRGRMNDLDKKRQRATNKEASEILVVQESRKTLDEDWTTLGHQVQDTTTAIHKRRNELRTIIALEQTVFNLRDEIDSLDDSENPYNELVGEAETELKDLAKQGKILGYERQALDIELRHLNFWDRGFSNAGLKSYVIENVIPYLNQRAQHYADILTGGDLKIEFATQKELKKGGVKEEFQVKVINRAGADVYKGNSDGERQRIDLAVGWALGDLAATRAKKPIRFKGLDEPFVNLDASGEDSVIKLLHSVLSEYETIVCITHNDGLSNQFPTAMTVVKENKISTMI